MEDFDKMTVKVCSSFNNFFFLLYGFIQVPLPTTLFSRLLSMLVVAAHYFNILISFVMKCHPISYPITDPPC